MVSDQASLLISFSVKIKLMEAVLVLDQQLLSLHLLEGRHTLDKVTCITCFLLLLNCRYYGRRKDEESDSELSLDSDSERKSPVKQQW